MCDRIIRFAFERKGKRHTAEKQAIATAAALVQPGMSISLDRALTELSKLATTGSTPMRLAAEGTLDFPCESRPTGCSCVSRNSTLPTC